MVKMEQPNYTTPHGPYPQPAPSHTIHVVPTTAYSNKSQHMNCPSCHANISTRIESISNTKTHLMALLLCLCCCWCCAPIPYCIDSCLIQNHYCPECGVFLGASQN